MAQYQKFYQLFFYKPLFNWIQEKTGIQIASQVRSTQGLLVHVFGKMVAAMLMLLAGF